MSAELSIASHLRLAFEALDGLTDMRPGNHFAAYLAQQAVEQIILALALSEEIQVPRSQHHQLDWIVRNLPGENAARPTLAKLTWLEAFATTYRYPRPSGRMPETPEPEKLDEAVATARELLESLYVHFGLEPASGSGAAASRTKPPRGDDLRRR